MLCFRDRTNICSINYIKTEWEYRLIFSMFIKNKLLLKPKNDEMPYDSVPEFVNIPTSWYCTCDIMASITNVISYLF